jgi:hypothetical protein
MRTLFSLIDCCIRAVKYNDFSNLSVRESKIVRKFAQEIQGQIESQGEIKVCGFLDDVFDWEKEEDLGTIGAMAAFHLSRVTIQERMDSVVVIY